MNGLQTSTLTTANGNVQDDKIDILDILDTLLDAKWLILGIAIAITIVFCAYAFIAQPTYQSNMLIQVEQSQQGGANPLGGEMAALFNVESPSSAEMEILRSRLVVGNAADELKLYIKAEPNYLPIIGRWLAKDATALSTPGIFGWGGYVTGSEAISVEKLDVPKELEGLELTLETTEHGYNLKTPDGESLISKGKINKIESFKYQDSSGHVKIIKLLANPGAEFSLIRSSRLDAISTLQTQLQISEKGKQSGMLAASLEGPNPEKTAAILNAIGQAYVGQNTERKAAEAEKSLAFLDTFLPQLKQQMQESEEKYTRFRDKHGTFDLTTESQLTLQSSVDLQAKLLELQQKRRELLPRFTPSHPAIKTINEQITAIQKQLREIESNVRRMPDLQQQLLSLMRNVTVNSEMYVNLLNSAQQLRLIKEGKVGNVRVVDPAVAPEWPIKPNRPLIIGLGALFGLIIGVGAALVRNKLRPGVINSAEIESTLGLHVFATIPHSTTQTELGTLIRANKEGNHVLATIAPTDPAIESLRSLRTALQFAMIEAKNNIVLLTGPTPSVGKSFTSVNFAAVLGSAEKRVLLIDADMRKGYINQYFGLNRKFGLSELIAKKLDYSDAIHKNVLPNVDLITTGVLPPNPAELLLSASAKEILEKLSADYDLVLLDTPPILAVSDALALAPTVGTVFLLTRAEVSTIREIDETTKRLHQAGATLNGVIFNDMPNKSRRYGASYDYSYSYS